MTEGEIRVPVVEERLNVEQAAGRSGAVEIRKDVTSERVDVPVDVTREEVPGRPGRRAGPPDVAGRSASGHLPRRDDPVPVRGEEVVAEKEAVVTGEVVIDREQRTERQTVSDTVRKRGSTSTRTIAATGPHSRSTSTATRCLGTAADTRTFADADRTTGSGTRPYDERYAGRDFAEMSPSCGAPRGRPYLGGHPRRDRRGLRRPASLIG